MTSYLTKAILAIFIVVPFSFAQTRQGLKSKYGAPDSKGRIIVRQGIGLSASFDEKGNPSKFILMPLEPGKNNQPSAMPKESSLGALEEICPVKTRGRSSSTFREERSCSLTEITKFEKVTIQIQNRCQLRGGGIYSIQITWPTKLKFTN